MPSSNIGEYDSDYYHDSGNEEADGEGQTNYIPHALMFGRKHNKIFEIVDDEIRFMPYNGEMKRMYMFKNMPITKGTNLYHQQVILDRK